MSSVAKGNKFEDQVFAAIYDEVYEGRLGLQPQQCRIFQKKGYYSRDRGGNIIVDISIELWLPGAPQWSMLWICECKDYSGSLPVDDVEEFKSKLDQISGKNVKGLLAITGALQRGAFNYAKSQGIGVVRILPEDQVCWVMYHMTSAMLSHSINLREFEQAFMLPRFRAENQSFFGNADGYFFDSWRGLLKKTLTSGEES
ncbi:restriction endonuclease [Nitrosomonas sp. Is35]|uniref:restriction endonuclease n=1 Tax=unclassified Nitrosomonas TaxID=2609265 RepID=UPI00294AC3A8|nr:MULTISPECIES: restriction endonuclease [unclassified Nitrosomonas]MDV6341912.1 restriction endonuclease [Nitrosomonas sp. Is24]MDV6347813.1 restriction endonuclease [Nitrosomonas sp. Is35]